jgi:hypothetical protein
MNEFLLTPSQAPGRAYDGFQPSRLEGLLEHPDVGLSILELIFENGLKAAQKLAMCSKNIWRIIGLSVVSLHSLTACMICHSHLKAFLTQ